MVSCLLVERQGAAIGLKGGVNRRPDEKSITARLGSYIVQPVGFRKWRNNIPSSSGESMIYAAV
jgi:hypothetical protein